MAFQLLNAFREFAREGVPVEHVRSFRTVSLKVQDRRKCLSGVGRIEFDAFPISKQLFSNFP